MKKLFMFLFILLSYLSYGYASPYASSYLYDDILEYIENPEKFADNVTNGYVENGNNNVIIGAYIESAYSVYLKEEEYTKEFTSCGTGCYKLNNTKDLLEAYNKFFYMYAIAEEINGILLQNIKAGENISYTLKDKEVAYVWKSNKLMIYVDNDIIEFIKDGSTITIKTDMQSLNKYWLD